MLYMFLMRAVCMHSCRKRDTFRKASRQQIYHRVYIVCAPCGFDKAAITRVQIYVREARECILFGWNHSARGGIHGDC